MLSTCVLAHRERSFQIPRDLHPVHDLEEQERVVEVGIADGCGGNAAPLRSQAIRSGFGYNIQVSSAEDILSAALELPTRERARVAHELLRSLDEAEEDGAGEAWTEELRKRLQQVKDGEVEPLNLEEVKRRFAERRAARRKTR